MAKKVDKTESFEEDLTPLNPEEMIFIGPVVSKESRKQADFPKYFIYSEDSSLFEAVQELLRSARMKKCAVIRRVPLENEVDFLFMIGVPSFKDVEELIGILAWYPDIAPIFINGQPVLTGYDFMEFLGIYDEDLKKDTLEGPHGWC